MTEVKLFNQFNALGNDTRLRIISYLASGEKCVCNIFQRLDLPQNLVSHHLKILRQRGFIADRKAGKWVFYSLNKRTLFESRKFLDNIFNKTKNNLTD